MKLSVTFTFIAVTVTSSCATASVVDNHHENAIIYHHNALPCTDALCDDDYSPVCGFDNKTYPNACIFQATYCRSNVTMAYFGPCRERFEDNQRAHSSASASSLNEKTPLVRDRAHSANEERGSSVYPESEILNVAWSLQQLDRMNEAINGGYNLNELMQRDIHPYTYLKVLHDRDNTWDKKLLRTVGSIIKGGETRLPNAVDEIVNEPGE
ncbi:Protease inhibitor protein [Plasmopara halstedii]|uniref:Protease inhibitor protein n=1 Tax=Plasmopara halstedii TaxID=4781 RepID=A0A0N7L511_PLAHL|nr:Protease inhibitor protein [Plasmopara halstedii]CEG40179.1 Protease inhibitor protein [Plasmopara halstedii]|eukprot:XP_024576548.1 Protease inhibitor protein [Plasmopara halstedii]